MKIITSPAKQQKMTPYDFETTVPRFIEKANFLAAKIKKMNLAELKKAFKCSDEIVKNVKIDYQKFNTVLHPALYLFHGLQYQNIGLETLNKKEIKFLLDNLLIADSLYGILKATDLISPYRLDYKTKLSFFNYDYYKEDLNKYLDDLTINLCSKEYSKNLNPDKLFTINFVQNVKGNIKSYSTHTKIARGKFIRYLAKCNASTFDVIRAYNVDDYYLVSETPREITFQKDF